MGNPTGRVEAAETEAAEWHSRLGTTAIATETLKAFFEWRAKPENADAYRRVEKIWADSQDLAADPEIAEALRAARARGEDRPAQRRRSVLYSAIAAATAVVLVVAGSAWWTSRGVFETEVGEQRLIQLADGSSVNLDTNSRMRVRFVADHRRIDLERGQALFTVAPDTDRPFVVWADDTQVTALGTVFDVRRDGGAVTVTLVSGVVEIDALERAAPPRRMWAGEKARVTPQGISTEVVDPAVETSWTTGRLIFTDQPLGEAVAEMNRYLTDKIEIDDPALVAVPVSGVFRAGDRDAFIAASSDGLGLVARPKADGTVGLHRREN